MTASHNQVIYGQAIRDVAYLNDSSGAVWADEEPSVSLFSEGVFNQYDRGRAKARLGQTGVYDIEIPWPDVEPGEVLEANAIFRVWGFPILWHSTYVVVRAKEDMIRRVRRATALLTSSNIIRNEPTGFLLQKISALPETEGETLLSRQLFNIKGQRLLDADDPVARMVSQ